MCSDGRRQDFGPQLSDVSPTLRNGTMEPGTDAPLRHCTFFQLTRRRHRVPCNGLPSPFGLACALSTPTPIRTETLHHPKAQETSLGRKEIYLLLLLIHHHTVQSALLQQKYVGLFKRKNSTRLNEQRTKRVVI